MSHEKPKVYTAEFKESAVKLANESAKSIAQTARDIGVNEKTLHSWISKYSRPIENTINPALKQPVRRMQRKGV